MPFIVFASAPLAAIAAVAGHLILYLRAKGISTSSAPGTPVDLAKLQICIRHHSLSCAGLTLLASLVFMGFGLGMVYGDKIQYLPATLLLAAGPFAAWAASTLFLGWLLFRCGVKWYWPVISLISFVLIGAGFVGLGMMLP